jgi:RNA polymerase sigma-70 factor (ECF subfamily)
MFIEHSEFVYRTALRVTGSPCDAEDVVQALFLRLLTHGVPEEIGPNPRGYLYRAAVNRSLNVIRNRRRDVLTSDAEEFDAHREEPADHRGLRKGLAELPSKAAEILILRYVHGYTISEIASLLGTSRGTVAVNLFRARSKLKKILGSIGAIG